MAKMGMRFTVTLELTEEEYRLVDTALNRQLKGDDVGRARTLSEKLTGERTALAKMLTGAGAAEAGKKAATLLDDVEPGAEPAPV